MGANAHAANRSVKTMMTINATDFQSIRCHRSLGLLDSVQHCRSAVYRPAGGPLELYQLQRGIRQHTEWMVDYRHQRAHPGGVLELDARRDGNSLLSLRRWTAGMPSAVGTMWIPLRAAAGSEDRAMDLPLSAWPDCFHRVAPGIRLKAIRDGIQDYEYAQILKNLGQVPLVNSIIVPIATSWSN